MRPMSTAKPIHIFKAGTHTAMSGEVLDFTEADLAATVSAYDPSVHEAPLVVGHPKHDKPRYGGVGRLIHDQSRQTLDITPRNVVPEFAEWVNKKLYTEISASFYPPNSPNNPKPGVYYLRHVGFLGAQPPAIKGLNPEGIELGESDDFVTFEFSEYDDAQNASLWRNVREWLIGKFGAEEADKVVPQYAVQQLKQSAQDELKEPAMESTDGILPTPAFTETLTGDPMAATTEAVSDDEIAALKAENARLKQQQADFAEQQKQAKTAADHTANLAFAEGLIKEGRLLPAQKDLTVSLLDFMAGQEQAVEFGEGEAKKPLLDVIKTDLLAKLPKQIEFGEVGAGHADEHAVNFAAPRDSVIDAESLQLHAKVQAYMAQHHTDYHTALQAVSK